jgi:hypothetical protein
MMHVFPGRVADGTAGVINSLFIGEAWANFGLTGVLIAPIYVGFLIGFFYGLLIRLPKTPLLIAIFVHFSYKSSVTGGINNYLYEAGILLFFIIVLSILALNILQRKKGFLIRDILR